MQVDCQAPLFYGIFQSRILKWVVISYPGHLPDAGIEPSSSASPALQVDFFTARLLEKPIGRLKRYWHQGKNICTFIDFQIKSEILVMKIVLSGGYRKI